MRPPTIDLNQLAALPIIYRAIIPPEFKDRNGHMNVRWYLATYDDAGDSLYPLLGLTPEYFAAGTAGGFDLEHHLRYLNEVHIGDAVHVRVRLLQRSAKLMHYMLFLVNDTRGNVASTFECIHAHADLRLRRTAPFPPQVTAKIDALIAEHSQLSWPAPTCGSMSL